MMQDNAAAVTLLQGPGGSWRTRPLKIRARSARERFENGFWALQHLPGEMMLADIGTKALGSSRLRALAEMMGMKMGESDAIPEKVGEGNAAKARVVRSIEHERGLLTGITCITLADAACMEDEEASREELLFWTALLVAVVAAWEALKWSERRAADAVRNLEKGEDCRSMSTTGGGVKVKAMQGGKERAMQRLLEKRAERESSEERQERSTEGGGSPGSSSAADGLEKEVDRAGNSHERNAGWKAGGGEARQTGLAPEKSFAAEWKVSLDEDETVIWEDVKKIFPGIMKEPVGTEDRWLEKGGYYIKMHCRRRVSEFDPRRGYMPKEDRAGEDHGDEDVGACLCAGRRLHGGVAVWTEGVCGFHDLQEEVGGGVLSWRQ